VGWSARVGALLATPVAVCRNNLERQPAALNEAERSVSVVMKGSKMPRIELSTVRLFVHVYAVHHFHYHFILPTGALIIKRI
jgi:hypothetical protein